MKKIGIIGCGVVGTSWAFVFARAGLDVRLHDADEAGLARAVDATLARLQGMPQAGRISATTSLAEVVESADYLQESAPERLEIKRALYAQIDQILPHGTIVGSSTSGLPASSFTQDMAQRARCLVAHPINPPHLVPFVELVPAPWTSTETVETVRALMIQVGQSPIDVRREINGFVVNRLQSALLGEAFRLVEDGICSVEDVDKAVRDGLGLRWCFMGPFETIDLNARGGVAEYCHNLGPMYYGLAQEQADPRPWTPDLVAKVETERRQQLPATQLAARQAWRDTLLAAIVATKRESLAKG